MFRRLYRHYALQTQYHIKHSSGDERSNTLLSDLIRHHLQKRSQLGFHFATVDYKV
jgi:hypothetical protein